LYHRPQGEEESAKPIVPCSSPDRQQQEHSGVKFIEADEEYDDETEKNENEDDEEKGPPGKSNLGPIL
jgi:hypothetical protein